MAKKKQRRSAFVPRLLLPAAAVVSVLPACAVASCTGDVATSASGFYVAAVAYPAYEAGTGGGSSTSTTTSTTTSTSASSSSGVPWVAAVAYPAYEAGTDNG